MLTEQEASDCQELLELINKKFTATTYEELLSQTFGKPLRKNINSTIKTLCSDGYVTFHLIPNNGGIINVNTITQILVNDFGKQFLKDGGYINKYKLQEKALEKERQLNELTELNIEVAKSTIKANKQNRIDAKENRIILIIGVILSAINILILILQ